MTPLIPPVRGNFSLFQQLTSLQLPESAEILASPVNDSSLWIALKKFINTRYPRGTDHGRGREPRTVHHQHSSALAAAVDLAVAGTNGLRPYLKQPQLHFILHLCKWYF